MSESNEDNRRRKNCIYRIAMVGLWLVVWYVVASSTIAAERNMTIDPTDFYEDPELGHQGKKMIVYEGEIFWSSKANRAESTAYRYNNMGWFVQVKNGKNQSYDFYVSTEQCLVKLEEKGEYYYFVYKISRESLIEAAQGAGYRPENFFGGMIEMELDGNVRLIDQEEQLVAGPYSLASDQGLQTLISEMKKYRFSIESENVVRDELRNKIMKVDGKDVLIEYIIQDSAPLLKAEDVYMYLNNELDEERLYRDVIAEDEEDGDITYKVVIQNLEEVKSELTKLKTQIHIEYDQYDIEMQYIVHDSAGNEGEDNVLLHAFVVADNNMTRINRGYIRFISENYIDTLEEKSIWRKSDMMEYLKEALASNESNKSF